MKTPLRLAVSAAFAVLLVTFGGAGCSGPSEANDHCRNAKYEGKPMEPFMDAAHHFEICIPRHLIRNGPAGFSDDRVVFTGFAVPPNTTLQSKTLVIVPGPDGDVQGATPFGHFSAGGVTFTRTKFYDGSAGHMTLHVTYYWKQPKGKLVTFDFMHYAVNPLVYDPGQRPPDYDQAAQIKLTENIMGTFVRLP